MDRAARWLWAHWGPRIPVYGTLIAAVVTMLAFGAPGATVVCLYLRLGLRDSSIVVVVASAVIFATFPLGTVLVAGDAVGALRDWRDGTCADPRAAHAVLREATRRVTFWTASFTAAGEVPILGALIVHFAHAGVAGWLVVTAWNLLLVVAGRVLMAITLDVLLRPPREEMARAIDGRVLTSEPGWSIRRRLSLGVGSIAWLTAVVPGLFALRLHTPVSQFAATLAAAVAVAALLGVGYFRVLALDPILRPLGDLITAQQAVGGGDLTARVVVTSADEVGELSEAFNEMVAGLQERDRLHAAFGSYVDPALAERLLRQGDDLFAGEEVEITVLFADVRDFTSFSEQSSAREAVARLNSLFEIIVPTVRAHGGHTNKFLGDGVLAAFGVPESLADHADRAVAAALDIQRQVADEFGGSLRLGIGINTGRVIAGTVGAAGKLEFTLIGDAVNAASRIEQLTKETGDPVLVAEATVDAMAAHPDLVDRGTYVLRGKSTPVRLFAHCIAPPR